MFTLTLTDLGFYEEVTEQRKVLDHVQAFPLPCLPLPLFPSSIIRPFPSPLPFLPLSFNFHLPFT